MLYLIKRLTTGLLLALNVVQFNPILVAAQLPSGEKQAVITPGDARKGRYVFRKCVACHQNNGVAVVCPDDKTRQQWHDHFNKKFRKCKQVFAENNFSKYQFTNVQMNHLLGFLYKYAKDSEERFPHCE